VGKINSRTKGKRGELEAAKRLNELFGTDCRRGQQYSGGNGDADVVGLPGVHLEIKRVQKLNIENAVEQAVSDAKGDAVPVVMHRRDHGEWLITVKLDDLSRLSWAVVELQGLGEGE
jgi:hypothetical protein